MNFGQQVHVIKILILKDKVLRRMQNDVSEMGIKWYSLYFSGKSVGSFGDGPGRYKQLLTDSGKVKVYDAYDGAPFCDTTSQGRVNFLDLTLPQYGLPVYDWIISLEVAEHIPSSFESVYIDNIVRHASEGIVLSWARPGQGGFQHINNRDIKYVIALFNGLGFYHDVKDSKTLQEGASVGWLKNNINVYRRREKIQKENMVLES